jgi:hypothetical protein
MQGDGLLLGIEPIELGGELAVHARLSISTKKNTRTRRVKGGGLRKKRG